MVSKVLLAVGIVGICSSYSTSAFAVNSLRLPPRLNSVTTHRASGAVSLRASIYDAIERKLTEGLKPTKLQIVDNSHQHAGMTHSSANHVCSTNRVLKVAQDTRGSPDGRAKRISRSSSSAKHLQVTIDANWVREK